jgi:hypothetical protein
VLNLKTYADIESATTRIIDTLQQAAKAATPIKNNPRRTYYLPSHIKQMVAHKRKTRARWQKTHIPEDKRFFTKATNTL